MVELRIVNITRLVVFLLTILTSASAYAEPLRLGEHTSIQYSITPDATTVSIEGVSKDSVTIFDVPDPQRIVVDLAEKGLKNPKAIKNIKSKCVKSIRFGTHIESFRIVIDLADVTCTHTEKSDEKNTVIAITSRTTPPAFTASPITTPTIAPTPTSKSASTPSSETLTPTPTASSTESPIASNTPRFTDTAFPTPAPTETPRINPTSTPVIEETPIPTPTRVAETTIISTGGKTLKKIDFSHEKDQPVLKLELSERMNFKLTKDSARQYRITINDCSVENAGLAMPQFPPNDMAGFTLVHAKSGEGKLEIVIGLDDGMRASAYNLDSTIIVHANPAGF